MDEPDDGNTSLGINICTAKYLPHRVRQSVRARIFELIGMPPSSSMYLLLAVGRLCIDVSSLLFVPIINGESVHPTASPWLCQLHDSVEEHKTSIDHDT
jgi:hypothetical protein